MLKKKLLVPVLTLGLLVGGFGSTTAHASTEGGKSLFTADMKTELTKSAADMKATAGEVLVLLTTTGVAIWGMSFPVKKGIRFLQKKAGRAM